MDENPNIAALAAQLADPARARMVLALMGGKALTVSELAQAAGLGKAGASAQVTRLEAAGLLTARRQGTSPPAARRSAATASTGASGRAIWADGSDG